MGKKGAPGSPNMVENYPERFVMFFADNSTVKRKIGELYATGKWSVTNQGEQCIQREDKKERCAPVYKDGKTCMGRIQWETKHTRFRPGNEYDL